MNKMENLIRRLLELEPGTPHPDAAKTAELAARFESRTPAATAQTSTMDLAARLDGSLDEEALTRQDNSLATSGQDYQDLAAAAGLADAVATSLTTAPADLLAQVAAPQQPRRRSPPWLWIGGTALAAALAAVLILNRQPPPADSKAPVIAAPKSEEAPRMLPAGNEDVVPDKSQRRERGAK